MTVCHVSKSSPGKADLAVPIMKNDSQVEGIGSKKIVKDVGRCRSIALWIFINRIVSIWIKFSWKGFSLFLFES